MSEAVAFVNVVKRHAPRTGREVVALSNISASVAQGECVAVIGRSGSGKSTLLHLAAAIDVPSAGSVRVLGRELSSMGERARTRLRRDDIGLVFQFFHLLPHLSVAENVALPGWIAGDAHARTSARAAELLDQVGLLERAADRADRLSGGEMQRVALCRALLRRPRLLLADEPTGNLDDENGRAVMHLLLALVRGERATLLFVTHSAEFAALADRTLRLKSGVLET